MKLEVGHIFINDIQFASESKIENGVLYVDEEAVKAIVLEDEKIKGVKSVRQQGLMIGIEVEGNAGDIAKKCTENGLLVITAKTLLRMLPPLNIKYEEIDEALAILKKVMEE